MNNENKISKFWQRNSPLIINSFVNNVIFIGLFLLSLWIPYLDFVSTTAGKQGFFIQLENLLPKFFALCTIFFLIILAFRTKFISSWNSNPKTLSYYYLSYLSAYALWFVLFAPFLFDGVMIYFPLILALPLVNWLLSKLFDKKTGV